MHLDSQHLQQKENMYALAAVYDRTKDPVPASIMYRITPYYDHLGDATTTVSTSGGKLNAAGSVSSEGHSVTGTVVSGLDADQLVRRQHALQKKLELLNAKLEKCKAATDNTARTNTGVLLRQLTINWNCLGNTDAPTEFTVRVSSQRDSLASVLLIFLLQKTAKKDLFIQSYRHSSAKDDSLSMARLIKLLSSDFDSVSPKLRICVIWHKGGALFTNPSIECRTVANNNKVTTVFGLGGVVRLLGTLLGFYGGRNSDNNKHESWIERAISLPYLDKRGKAAFLGDLNSALSNFDWLLGNGEAFSLADVVTWAQIKSLDSAMKNKSDFEPAKFPNVKRWMERFVVTEFEDLANLVCAVENIL